jgi:hypothetical protein
MARVPQAKILILTAEDAMAEPIAMAIATAGAQRVRRGRCRRNGGDGQNRRSERRKQKLFHGKPPSET